MADPVRQTVEGEGYAVGHIDGLGEGPGFRKIRAGLGVTAFGMNAIVLPGNYVSRNHSHERQEETYFVHRGSIAIEFGDGTEHVLDAGGLARVDPRTVRRLRNLGDDEAVYICVGGADGYVGRDGVLEDGENASASAGGA
jgi:mannose-6-phosphate isomerase-like protein (cupin superfamily)